MPELTVCEIMGRAAKDNGCSHVPYSQRIAIDANNSANTSGACYGLAFAWLCKMAKKEGGKKYLKTTGGMVASSSNASSSDVRPDIDARAFMFAEQIHNLQRTSSRNMDSHKEGLLGLTELRRAIDNDGEEKFSSFDVPDDLSGFAGWINGSQSMRYFSVHTKNHSMAACGSRNGYLFFYDPNGGIVRSWFPDSFARCLKSYFSNDWLAQQYWSKSEKKSIDVYKYVKG